MFSNSIDDKTIWFLLLAGCVGIITVAVYYHCFPSNAVFKHEQITTIIISDSKSCILWINKLLFFSPKVVGIDCEWKSGKNTKISLLQIAYKDLILLIRLHLIFRNNNNKISSFPMELLSFLNNINILKCGVGICGDQNKLYKDYNIEMLGCIELNDILISDTCIELNNNNNTFISLQKMYKLMFSKEMKYKNSNINHLKWESNNLSLKQIHYAADDALCGYLIFNKIIKNHYNKQIKSSKTYLEICYGKIDRLSSSSSIKTDNINIDKNKHSVKSRCDREWSRRLTYKRYGYATKILDHNGNILTLSSANLKRYLLKNNSAKVINDVDRYFMDKRKKVIGHDQYVIQLLNPPDIVDIKNNNLMDYVRSINVKELECYICGRDQNLTRVFLIPKHYPKYINCAKKIHYAVPVCLTVCQRKVFKWRYSFEKKLLDKYKVTNQYSNQEIKLQNKLKIYALTLQKRKKRYEICVEIQNKWIQQILSYFNVIDRKDLIIKDCDINKEINIDWYYMNDYNYLIIKYFINKFIENDKVNNSINKMIIKLYEKFKGKEIEFIEIWRRDFMKTFKPKCHNQYFETLQIFCTDFEWQS